MNKGKQFGSLRTSKACIGLSVLLLASILPFRVHAAGLWMFEDAGPTVGTASAGRAAIADDATTARGNPAGMTRLNGNQLVVGAQPIIYTVKFDGDEPGTFGGANGGDAGNVFPSLGLYYVRELAPDWRHPVLGLSVGQLLAVLPPGQFAEPMEM